MRRFWWTFAQILVRPHRASAAIAADPNVRRGLAATGLFGGLYSIAALTSYRVGRRPRARIFTFIPEERYYLWESIYCLPLTLLWIALSAAIVRRLSVRAGGTGTFEADLSVLAFTQTGPMIVLVWLPDMACYLGRVPEHRYVRLVPIYGWSHDLGARLVDCGHHGNRTHLVAVSADRAARLRDRERGGQRRRGGDALGAVRSRGDPAGSLRSPRARTTLCGTARPVALDKDPAVGGPGRPPLAR